MSRSTSHQLRAHWSGAIDRAARPHRRTSTSCAREGYRTGLVTNNVHETSVQWRALVPVDKLFDAIVDSSDVGMRKPNPAIFFHTLDLLGGVPPAYAVFLDDTPGNVDGARTAGLHAILVDPADPAGAIDELDALLAAGCDRS